MKKVTTYIGLKKLESPEMINVEMTGAVRTMVPQQQFFMKLKEPLSLWRIMVVTLELRGQIQ